MSGMERPLRLVMFSYDTRDDFIHRFDSLLQKLERDRFEPERNNFLFITCAATAGSARQGDRFRRESFTLPFWFKPLADILFYIHAPALLARAAFAPDVLIITDPGQALAAARLSRSTGAPVIYLMTNQPKTSSETRTWGSFKSAYSGWLERISVGRVDMVYTLNETMRAYARSFGIPDGQIVIFAPDTIARERDLIDAAAHGIRAEAGIPTEGKILLSVGRLVEEKGFDRLMLLFAGLPHTYHLVIAGEGALRTTLEGQAAQLGIAERVRFLGALDRSAVWRWYKDADAFVLLSRVEALGLVVWEAMYAGLPVVGSHASGIAESIGRHRERGLLVADDADSASFRESVAWAVEHSPEREAMVRRARQYIESKLASARTFRASVEEYGLERPPEAPRV
jgi:glycosyltransferase involved in cell wall biosynthesis